MQMNVGVVLSKQEGPGQTERLGRYNSITIELCIYVILVRVVRLFIFKYLSYILDNKGDKKVAETFLHRCLSFTRLLSNSTKDNSILILY